MKLRTTETEFYSSNQVEQQSFKISASAKAFKILSSNLYKNKIRAIIRELSANAVDAHVAAGNPDKKFLIQLPSAVDPMFQIRDYGIGLSKEQVFNLYTTYFESTKAESDDYVGALGLGSKSPFSYVDSFTVTSFYNGVKTIYDMSLKSGVPNVAELFESETDEENGLSVSMPVRQDDFTRFADEASYVLKTFSNKPEVTGREIEIEQSIVEDFGTYYTCNDATYGYNGIYALMGGIAYPIPRQYWSESTISSYLSSGIRQTIFMRFELGELDITPSREELSYDPETEKVIHERINFIDSKFTDEILLKFKDQTCPRTCYEKIESSYRGSIRSLLKSTIEIDGKSINAWDNYFSWKPYKTFTVDDSDKKITKTHYSKYRRVTCDSVLYDIRSETRGASSYQYDNLASISRKSLILLLNDDGKQIAKTMKGLFKSGKVKYGDYLYVMQYRDYKDIEIVNDLIVRRSGDVVVFKNSEQADVRKLIPVESKERVPQKTQKIVLKNGNISIESANYYLSDIDDCDGYYAFKYFDEYCDIDTKRVGSFNVISEYMIAKGIEEVLIVRKQHWDRIKKNKNATCIYDAINDTLDTVNGKRVSIKSPKSGKQPNWMSPLSKYPNLINLMYNGKNKPRKKHHLYDFMYSVLNDNWAIISESGSKNLNDFRGQEKRYTVAFSKKNDIVSEKYVLISTLLSNMYSYEIKKHINQIELFIKSFK